MTTPDMPAPGDGGGIRVLASLDAIQQHLQRIDRRLDTVERELGLATARAAVTPAPVAPETPAAPVPAVPVPAVPAGRPVPAWMLASPSEEPAAAAPAPAVAAPPTAPAIAPPPHEPLSLRDLEARLTGRALAWAGGAALIFGAVFLLSLAFTRGWITAEMRVAMGLVGGSVALAAAAWCFERSQKTVAHVLAAVGLGTLSLALYAATRLYGFVPPEVALAGSFLAAVIATGLALRYDAQVVAALGLVAVVAAPPVLGAPGNLVTMAFLGTALVGTTAIALFRSWPWLPRLAFVLAAPQVLWWVGGDPPPEVGLGAAVLGGFWALNAVAAAGTELTTPPTRLGRPSAALLVLATLFTVGAGLVLVGRSGWDPTGTLLALLGLAHLLLAGWLFRLRGDHHRFGLLAAGLGVALLVAAVPVEYDGPRVPILWTAMAVALAVPYARRAHGPAGLAAATVGALAIAHLGLVEYPLAEWQIAGTAVDGVPFASEGGLVLAGLLGGAAVAAWLVRDLAVRAGLAVVAALLVAYTLPFETQALALVGAWLAMTLALVAGERALEVRLRAPAHGALADQPLRWLAGPAIATALLAIGHLLATQLPPAELPAPPLPAVPFVEQPTVYAALIVAALIAAAVATTEAVLRPAAVVAATAVAGYLVAFEVPPAVTVPLWCGLAALQVVAIRWDRPGRLAYLGAGAVLVGVATVQALLVVAPPARLAVTASGVEAHPFFVSAATLAFGSLAAILAGAAWILRRTPLAPWLAVGAGVAAVYLLSVGVVDAFAGRVGGDVALEELQRQAQVALSILWAAIGFVTFAVGAVRNLALAREFGLALLAIATVKVFVFDLSFLDVAYRVLSFIGLGLLLLAGAYVFHAHRPRPGGQGRAA